MISEALIADPAADTAAIYPRIRYMGSKYKLLPHLADVFTEVGGKTALDAFSGSGVVSYLMKRQGFNVTSNDMLQFPGVIAAATVANQTVTLNDEEVETIIGPAADGRDFISKTFCDVYFDDADRAFLDSAWSHIDDLSGEKNQLL